MSTAEPCYLQSLSQADEYREIFVRLDRSILPSTLLVPCLKKDCNRSVHRNAPIRHRRFCHHCLLPFCSQECFDASTDLHGRLCRTMYLPRPEGLNFTYAREPGNQRSRQSEGPSVGLVAVQDFRPGEIVLMERPILASPFVIPDFKVMSDAQVDACRRNYGMPPHHDPRSYCETFCPTVMSKAMVDRLFVGDVLELARFARHFNIIHASNFAEAFRSVWDASQKKTDQPETSSPPTSSDQPLRAAQNCKTNKITQKTGRRRQKKPPTATTKKEANDTQYSFASDEVQRRWIEEVGQHHCNPYELAGYLLHGNLIYLPNVLNLSLDDPSRGDLVMGVLAYLLSFFNHSCSPNCVALWVGNMVVVVAGAKGLQQGMSATIAYVSYPLLRQKEASQLLRQAYGFTCVCEACAQQYVVIKSDRPLMMELLQVALNTMRPLHHTRMLEWMLCFERTQDHLSQVPKLLTRWLRQATRHLLGLHKPPAEVTKREIKARLDQEIANEISCYDQHPVHLFLHLMLKVWASWNRQFLVLLRHKNFYHPDLHDREAFAASAEFLRRWICFSPSQLGLLKKDAPKLQEEARTGNLLQLASRSQQIKDVRSVTGSPNRMLRIYDGIELQIRSDLLDYFIALNGQFDPTLSFPNWKRQSTLRATAAAAQNLHQNLRRDWILPGSNVQPEDLLVEYCNASHFMGRVFLSLSVISKKAQMTQIPTPAQSTTTTTTSTSLASPSTGDESVVASSSSSEKR